jgi:hypothetical protein
MWDNFTHQLAHCAQLKFLPAPEFEYELKRVYAKALFAGLKRIGLNKLYNLNKEPENVTDKKSNGRTA